MCIDLTLTIVCPGAKTDSAAMKFRLGDLREMGLKSTLAFLTPSARYVVSCCGFFPVNVKDLASMDKSMAITLLSLTLAAVLVCRS